MTTPSTNSDETMVDIESSKHTLITLSTPLTTTSNSNNNINSNGSSPHRPTVAQSPPPRTAILLGQGPHPERVTATSPQPHVSLQELYELYLNATTVEAQEDFLCRVRRRVRERISRESEIPNEKTVIDEDSRIIGTSFSFTYASDVDLEEILSQVGNRIGKKCYAMGIKDICTVQMHNVDDANIVRRKKILDARGSRVELVNPLLLKSVGKQLTNTIKLGNLPAVLLLNQDYLRSTLITVFGASKVKFQRDHAIATFPTAKTAGMVRSIFCGISLLGTRLTSEEVE